MKICDVFHHVANVASPEGAHGTSGLELGTFLKRELFDQAFLKVGHNVLSESAGVVQLLRAEKAL